jgi:hypothetical protein
MDGLHRVSFKFGPESEIRYLTGIPELGDRVSHANELWVVADVEHDLAGPLVVCELSSRTHASNGDG